MQRTCNYCHSVLEITGHLDFSAPVMQHIICPVCGFDLYLPTDFPASMRYDAVPKIVTRVDPLLSWADYQKAHNIDLTIPAAPGESELIFDPIQSLTQGLMNVGTSISKGVSEFGAGLQKGATDIGKAITTPITQTAQIGLIVVAIALIIGIFLVVRSASR